MEWRAIITLLIIAILAFLPWAFYAIPIICSDVFVATDEQLLSNNVRPVTPIPFVHDASCWYVVIEPLPHRKFLKSDTLICLQSNFIPCVWYEFDAKTGQLVTFCIEW